MFALKTALLKNFPQRIRLSAIPKFLASNEKLTSQELKTQETPVYLRPYDKQKYEVPSSKIKMGSGYALLDLEPMPRAKIMKICYTLLDKMKEIPEKALYRLYTEEKVKYIMRLTDEIDDIKRLEEELESKPWEPREEKTELLKYAKVPRAELKHNRYDKPAREPAKFIEKK